jgi:hypothetical protein
VAKGKAELRKTLLTDSGQCVSGVQSLHLGVVLLGAMQHYGGGEKGVDKQLDSTRRWLLTL